MQTSRIVVIAAGVGSRLQAKAKVKPLVRIGGLTLLERSIVAAKEAGFDDIVVVTGHEQDGVAHEALDVSRRRQVPVTVVHNARYLEGNGLSVLATRAVIGQAPFALVMADHVFAPGLLRRLRTTSVEPGEIVVTADRSLGRAAGVDPADAMKVRLRGNRVDAMAKTLDAYDAFDVGAFVCTPAVFDALEECAAVGATSLADAVETLAKRGKTRVLVLEESEWWFDVDTPIDHRRGSRYLFGGTGKPLDGAVATRLNRTISQRLVTPGLLGILPGITPNQVTLVAFAVAFGAAVALALQAPVAAAVLITAASVLDGSDGEIARLTHRTSRFGSFFDAVLDRAADGLLFTGVAIYLSASPGLAATLGPAHQPIVIAMVAAGLVGHLLVSYTTAKADVDLGHRYHGRVVAGSRGRDLRLLILTVGALGSWLHPIALLAAVSVVAVLCILIVTIRLRASWWAEGPGARFMGVRAVAFDFDGTIADTMAALTTFASDLLSRDLGISREEARNRYLATVGEDFRTQLTLLTPRSTGLDEMATQFESAKDESMTDLRPFDDAVAAFERLGGVDVPTLVCSSTRGALVREFCRRHGLSELASTVDGWRPGHSKAAQLRTWVTSIGLRAEEVLFVGDALRDAAIAEEVGVRFIGLTRAGHPDLFAGSGIQVVASLSELARDVVAARRSPLVHVRAVATDSVALAGFVQSVRLASMLQAAPTSPEDG